MTGCSIAAKRMGNDLITGKKKIADISSEMKTATASTKALGVAMNIFANVGFMLAIAAITKVVSELAQAQENATQAAKEATETYKDEISSINDYKTKLSELHEELNSGNLSYEETKTKRTELMSIQDELIEKFGTGKGAIESVTEAINGQVDALDSLNEKSYRDWISKADNQTVWNKLLPWGKSGLDQAVDYMETSQTVSFNDMQNANLSEELQAIQKEIDETIRKKYNLDKSLATFNVTGTPDEIKSQLENIRQDYLDLSKNAFLENGISSEVWEEYRKEAIDSINEVINKFDEGLEKHQETYQTYIEGMIKYDSEYSDEYATILQKRAALESAEISGNADNIQKARQEFMNAINNGIQVSDSDENIKKYFESLYPELQAEFDSWNFEVAINANTDGLANKVKEIGENFTAVDLLNMVNTDGVQDGEDAFNSLIDKAIEYGVCTDNSSEEVQKLIDLLVKLGIVQGEVQDSISNNETDILSFTDLLNSADYKDIKEKLLDIAKSGEITEETLSSTEEYNKLLEETGTSADSAKNQILDMLSAQEKLSATTQGLNKLKSAYEEFKNKDIGFVTAETLESLPDVFKSLPEFDLFSKIVGDPQSGAKKIQQAFNDICKAYLLSQDTLSGLVGASQSEINSYVANLKQMGVTNAQEFVNQTVEALNSENKLINEAETEFYNMYLNYIEGKSELDTDYLKDTASKNGKLASALGSAYQQDYENWCDLLSQKAEAYNEFVEAVGGSYDESLSITGNMLNNGKTNITTRDIVNAYTAQAEYLRAQKEADAKKQELKLDINPIKTNFGTHYSPSSTNSNKGGSGSDSKDTKQAVDWISRLLDVLQKKIDALKAAFDNALTLKDKKNNLAEQIKLIKNLLTATTTAAERYKKAAEKVGLSDTLKKKVREGSYDITEYGSDTAEKIQKYQEWY